MHLKTLIVALVPLLIAAEELDTVTSTSYVTLTRTVTLQRAAVVTGYHNGTIHPTASITIPPTSGSSAPTPGPSTGAAPVLGAVNVAAAAVAGAVFAAFL